MSFRATRSLGLASLLFIVIAISLFSYSVTKKNIDRLRHIVDVENVKLRKWYNMVELLRDSKDRLYEYRTGKTEVISPAILLIQRASKELSAIKEITVKDREFEVIRDVERQLRIFKQVVFGYQYEVREGFRSGTSTMEMETAVLEAADNIVGLGVTAVNHVSKQIQEGYDVVFKAARASQNVFGLISFGAVALFVLLSSLMNRALASPIHKLVEGTNKLADGDLAYRLDIATKDEIGQLAKSFNEMAINLQKADKDIREKSKHLKIALEKAQTASQVKTSFLTNMSHEIRTPMNSILGFGDLLRKTRLDAKQKKYLEMISISGSLLLALIDDILDISRLESGKLNLESINFNLEDLIHDVFGVVVSRMKDKPFDTYIDIDSEVPKEIVGDPTRLKQVLINLLGNAVKFTTQGQVGVLVRVDNKSEDGGEYVLRFCVKDSGIGISPEKRKMIFEAFNQADGSTTRKFGGVGLGLAISAGIINMMGGRIWVESEEGVGSEFLFVVKLRKGKFVASQEMDQGTREILERKRVFIIDDNQIARKIIRRCCEVMGLKIVGEADSPYSAMQKLDRIFVDNENFPDLILCDIVMEGMDGYELAQEIRKLEKFDRTKCIAITADIKAEGSSEAPGDVFDAYITKPVIIKEMIKTVVSVLCVEQGEGGQEVSKEVARKSQRFEDIKVLVVEDNQLSRDLIEVYLSVLGCQVEFAWDGEKAVEMVRENHYDICLMDLQMPVMDGEEAAKIIRADGNQELPIVVITARVLEEDRENCLKAAGVTDYLFKPVKEKELEEVIVRYACSGNGFGGK
ncbi:MAG: response regulator [Candidatus Omnitrophica bacterium]|nr:response regulator [Candidatus Omnitrophota bacterium]